MLCAGRYPAPAALRSVKRMKGCGLVCSVALCECVSGLYMDLLQESLCNIWLKVYSVFVHEVCRVEHEERHLYAS